MNSETLRVLSSPGRYVQGKDAIHQLGKDLAQLGSSPLLVADDVVWGIVQEQVAASLAAADLTVARRSFGTYATPEAVDELVETISEAGHDVIVGLGGGSAIDAAKAAGHLAGIRWASVPTAASSDAPTSSLSVIYSKEGKFLEYRFFPRNPDLVLIDTQIVANAPEALLIGGIGDALATWIEARATSRSSGTTMAGGLPTQAGTALAKLSWDLLLDNSFLALESVRAGVVTPALEKVVEAATLLSGLGFESGGLAAAHAIHNALTAAPQAHGLSHGQKVNLGTMTQLVLEGAPTQEIEEFVEFTTKVGLPNSLSEIGLTPENETELRAVAEGATIEDETIHNMPFPVTADQVFDALKAVEGISRHIRAAKGLPAPVMYVAQH